MATYTVAASPARAAWGKTTVADTEDTVTITGNRGRVRITFELGAEPIYFTVNDTPATVGGVDCDRVPPVAWANVESDVASSGGPDTVVRLISAGVVKYSVEAGV